MCLCGVFLHFRLLWGVFDNFHVEFGFLFRICGGCFRRGSVKGEMAVGIKRHGGSGTGALFSVFGQRDKQVEGEGFLNRTNLCSG